MTWTDERVETLKELWQKGDESAARIAKQLGGGLTRNAVLGKLNRLRENGELDKADGGRRKNQDHAERPKRLDVRPVPRKKRNPQPPTWTKPEIWQPEPGQKPVSLLEIGDDMCRWPYGNPKAADFGFCGRSAAPGYSFCTEHCDQVFEVRKKRLKAATRRRSRKSANRAGSLRK